MSLVLSDICNTLVLFVSYFVAHCSFYNSIKEPTNKPTDAPSPQPTHSHSPPPQPIISASPVPSVPNTSPTVKPTPPKPTPPTSILVVELINPNEPFAPVGTYFPFDEADWEALFGALCQFNPCQAQNATCGAHGTCAAISETEATCKCDTYYSGDTCETSCGGYCLGGVGTHPYGCNPVSLFIGKKTYEFFLITRLSLLFPFHRILEKP